MKQTNTEKIDPLMRIQEEIAEVVRREQEYKQLTSHTTVVIRAGDGAATAAAAAAAPAAVDNDEIDGDIGGDFESKVLNGNINNKNFNNINGKHNQRKHKNDNSNDNENNNNNHDNELLNVMPLISTLPMTKVSAVVAAMQDDHSSTTSASNTPSLTSSVHSKESLDEHHSDDSGISASTKENDKIAANKERRYIGPNCYKITPEPPRQQLLERAVSTLHIAISKKSRHFAFGPAQKGVMERFIASRGKLHLQNKHAGSSANDIFLNGKTAATLLGSLPTPPNTPQSAPATFNMSNMPLSPPVVERDAEGRPIRRGYVPVELKIQRELKDLKSRESELKKIRKIRQSTSDLLDSIDNENVETDDESDVEHCYGPGKLRASKSISELCEVTTTQFSSGFSPSATPSPDYDSKLNYQRSGSTGMRPAMSLAQLCDLDPEEAPSSHRLIAQWETLIQQNA